MLLCQQLIEYMIFTGTDTHTHRIASLRYRKAIQKTRLANYSHELSKMIHWSDSCDLLFKLYTHRSSSLYCCLCPWTYARECVEFFHFILFAEKMNKRNSDQFTDQLYQLYTIELMLLRYCANETVNSLSIFLCSFNEYYKKNRAKTKSLPEIHFKWIFCTIIYGHGHVCPTQNHVLSL